MDKICRPFPDHPILDRLQSEQAIFDVIGKERENIQVSINKIILATQDQMHMINTEFKELPSEDLEDYRNAYIVTLIYFAF